MITVVLGLHIKVLGEAGTGVDSVRRRWKLPMCPTESMPVNSKTDLVLAKAEPISDCGSASGDNRFKKGEIKPCATSAAVRREE